jgi:hypothetical protein
MFGFLSSRCGCLACEILTFPGVWFAERRILDPVGGEWVEDNLGGDVMKGVAGPPRRFDMRLGDADLSSRIDPDVARCQFCAFSPGRRNLFV